MANVLFVDVETTGLDPRENGIIQISGQAMVDFDLKDPFDFKVKPLPDDEILDKALAVSGYTREQIQSDEFEKATTVQAALVRYMKTAIGKDRIDWDDKFVFAYYSGAGGFDYNFVREWHNKTGDRHFGYRFWFPPVDIAQLAAAATWNRRSELRDFKLGSVARWFGIPVDNTKLHDALYDIYLTVEIFRHVREYKLFNDGLLTAEKGIHIRDFETSYRKVTDAANK